MPWAWTRPLRTGAVIVKIPTALTAEVEATMDMLHSPNPTPPQPTPPDEIPGQVPNPGRDPVPDQPIDPTILPIRDPTPEEPPVRDPDPHPDDPPRR